jgi:8-oxo-dGTP pyrophosphatase MutT (NUDIX family)
MEHHDVGFTHDSSWFRLRACAIILDGDRVLMARNSSESYYYAVGGGVHLGEPIADAVRREVREETGWELDVERLVYVHETFFDGSTTAALNGLACHELAFYFLMAPPPADAPLRRVTLPNGVVEQVEWVRLADYGRDLEAFPTFFATELATLPEHPRLITTFG